MQISNNLIYLTGYQKLEIINKPFDILIPSIFIKCHAKKIEEFLNSFQNLKNEENESFNDKNIDFILIFIYL